MKSLKLFLLLIFAANLGYAQNMVSLMNKADLFFDNMDNEKYAEAHDFFDVSVKDKITPDELKLFWLRLGNTLGAYQSVDAANSTVQGENYVITLDCGFAKGNQSFRFIFNPAEKLIGFFVVPKLQAEYVPPAYLDTNLFDEEEITVKFANGQMAGMFTKPKGKTNFPVVVLVHGSGPSDMDETIGANKPFKDLAAGLAARGIGTVRYVKRTMVYPSLFNKIYTVNEEVVEDALTAAKVAAGLPGVNKDKVYLLGHSLGGMLAPRIASQSPEIKGIILAAAPARKLTDLIAEQTMYMYNISGDTSARGKQQFVTNMDLIGKSRLLKLGDMAPDSVILGTPAAYWVDLNNYDQVATMKRLNKPVLVLQGNYDFQVSVIDYNLWKTGLAGNKNVSMKLYPELNHLLSIQKEKGTSAQYRMPGNVSAEVIDDIAEWINK